MRMRSAVAAAVLTLSLTYAAAARAATWAEVGDAGGAASPQFTHGSGELTSISGSRGGSLDPVDAFVIRIDVAGVLDASALALPTAQPMGLTLYDAGGTALFFGSPMLSTSSLVPGLYIIEVREFDLPNNFSAYSLSFITPVSFAGPLPEPSLLPFGAAALLLIRRRR